MDHEKIESLLKSLDTRRMHDAEMSMATERAIDDAAEMIRSLRTECGNQETRIAELEVETIPQMVEALEAFADAASSYEEVASSEEYLIDKRGTVSVSDLREARAVLSLLKPKD